MKHGTLNGYNYHKCRCDDCKLAKKNSQIRQSPEFYKDRRKNNERYKEQERQRNKRRRLLETRKASNRKYHSSRRARLINAFVENVDHSIVFEAVDYICQQCGIACDKEAVYPAKDFPSLDHIIPLSKGGEHSYNNVQLLCLECNLRKSDKLERPANNV